MKKLTHKYDITVNEGFSGTACDLVSSETGISKVKIKDAMQKGALWHKERGREKAHRLRRAKGAVRPGDRLEFYYDEVLLSIAPPEPALVEDLGDYSVWLKPAGLMSQGTRECDHCSLLRYAELFFDPRRPVYLIHRLDREVEGIMLIAHTKKAASAFSALFSKGCLLKNYRALVRGRPAPPEATIDIPLDGKSSRTTYRTVSFDDSKNAATLDISIETGRYHQIRRHLDMIGHPVMGDPRYGKDNKNSSGLELKATGLTFTCPLSGIEKSFNIKNI